ncbi:MAG: amino acid permease [Gammaproteobacteria bacterium]|nr:amino acid permease [Gammaproteobacteria bacterium]
MQTDGDEQATSKSGDRHSIGLVGAVAIGIGGMVGGGIFAVLGVAATDAGGATPLAFLVGGLISVLTAISYSKLSVAYPSAGGTVAFVDRIFGINELTGSLNVVLWAGYVATTALYASAFGHYSATLFPGGTDPTVLLLRGLIFAGILLPWLINLSNAGLVARTEGAIVIIKLIILGVVIAAGVPAVSPTKLAPSSWPSLMAVVAAGMLIFVAYEGFELIANASADVRDRSRTLPRAFALAVGIVIVLYVLVSAVVVGSLTPAQISKSADFALAQAASATLGSIGFRLVAVAAILATLSAINATLYGAARLSYTIASVGELPDRFERLKWNEPIGLHITAGAGLAIAVGLPLTSISALASAIFLIVFTVTNAAAFRVGRQAGVRRGLAAAGVIGCAGSLVVLLVRSGRHDPAALLTLFSLLALALGAEHLILKRRPQRHNRPLISIDGD